MIQPIIFEDVRPAGTDPRLTMARLPGFLQVPLTLAIGKPLPGQQLPVVTPLQLLALYAAVHLAGLLSGAFFAFLGGWWLILMVPSWYLTVVGARHLQVGAVHHMAHHNFTRKAGQDNFLGRFLSMWLMIEEFDSYQAGHIKHHAQTLSTPDDPTVQSLEKAGLLNGMTEKALKRRLLVCLLSPVYHGATAFRRIASYLNTGVAAWKILAFIGYLGFWGTVTFFYPLETLLFWWVPMIWAYQSCSLVRAVVEHWPEDDGEGLAAYAEKTSAIFCGVPLPEASGNSLRDAYVATRWGARMAGEILCRYAFVSADGPNHDLHHLFPRSKWENDAALRLEVLDKVGQRGLPPLTETWGFWNTFEQHISAISAARPS